MHSGTAASQHDRKHVVSGLLVVAAVTSAIAALIAFAPALQRNVAETGHPAAADPAASPDHRAGGLNEYEKLGVWRLLHAGSGLSRERRRELVREVAPALTGWIHAMEARLTAAGSRRIPSALQDRLAMSFRLHELTRARYVVDPVAFAAAEDAGYLPGGRAAVAFGDVIVFRDYDAVRSEREWAFQLVYQRLFHRRGGERFVTRYLDRREPIDRRAAGIVIRHLRASETVFGAGESGQRATR